MNLDVFRASLERDHPPPELGRALEALWHAGKGDWDAAHRLAQAQKDRDGDWVHAYLHRFEGDEGNAGYWYRRAGRPHASGPLEREWDALVTALLG